MTNPHARTGPSPAALADALRLGHCPPDSVFDSFLPPDLRTVSVNYWTPLAVAVEAAHWLEEFGAQRVLDIGAGPGKFCIAAALAGRCEHVGLEHRARLVDVANQLAQQFAVQRRVQFLHASLDGLMPSVDAYYLFNPFGENLFEARHQLSDDIELNRKRYWLDVGVISSKFRRAPRGTLVLTYNGFGCCMPASYEPLRVDASRPCVLRLWRKWCHGDDGSFSGADAD